MHSAETPRQSPGLHPSDMSAGWRGRSDISQSEPRRTGGSPRPALSVGRAAVAPSERARAGRARAAPGRADDENRSVERARPFDLVARWSAGPSGPEWRPASANADGPSTTSSTTGSTTSSSSGAGIAPTELAPGSPKFRPDCVGIEVPGGCGPTSAGAASSGTTTASSTPWRTTCGSPQGWPPCWSTRSSPSRCPPSGSLLQRPSAWGGMMPMCPPCAARCSAGSGPRARSRGRGQQALTARGAGRFTSRLSGARGGDPAVAPGHRRSRGPGRRHRRRRGRTSQRQ